MVMNWIRGALHDLGLLLIRAILGAVFVYHGSQKLFGVFEGPGLAGFTSFLNQLEVPYPAYATVLVAATEFLGGIALILGIWTRLAAFPLAVVMGTAIALVHRDAFSVQHNGMEYALTLCVSLLGLVISGPGKVSCSSLLQLWKAHRESGKSVDDDKEQSARRVAPESRPAERPRSAAAPAPSPSRLEERTEPAAIPPARTPHTPPASRPAVAPATVGQQAAKSRSVVRVDEVDLGFRESLTASRLLPTPAPVGTVERAS